MAKKALFYIKFSGNEHIGKPDDSRNKGESGQPTKFEKTCCDVPHANGPVVSSDAITTVAICNAGPSGATDNVGSTGATGYVGFRSVIGNAGFLGATGDATASDELKKLNLNYE